MLLKSGLDRNGPAAPTKQGRRAEAEKGTVIIWMRSLVMEQKIRFVTQAAVPGANISALCRESGISRPTGYYWLKRYREADSVAALQERSQRPHHSPRRTAGWVEARVVQLRRQHGWGGKKLQVLLQREGVHLSGPKPRRGQSSFRRGVLGGIPNLQILQQITDPHGRADKTKRRP